MSNSACSTLADQAAGPTVAVDLDQLVCRLQPLFQQRENLCARGDLSLAARQRAVAAVEADLKENGFVLFVEQVTQISRAFLQQKNFWRLGGRPLDPEDFVMEVLLRLTTARIQDYDPARGRFATWLRAGVVRTTYAEMKRRDDPYWGRPLGGARAEQARARSRALAETTSLDLPIGEGRSPLQEVLSSAGRTPEQVLLEEQCACRFRDALRSLAPEEQVLIERAYLFDETHEAIARSLGVTRVAVTRRLGRICERLVARLGDSFCEDCAGTEFAMEWLGGGDDD